MIYFDVSIFDKVWHPLDEFFFSDPITGFKTCIICCLTSSFGILARLEGKKKKKKTIRKEGIVSNLPSGHKVDLQR